MQKGIKVAEFPYYRFYPGDYLADTTHLSTIEHGAYLLLLMAAWRSRGQVLPDDDKLLAKYARLTKAQWLRIRPTISEFWTIKNGEWSNGRLLDEYEAVRRHIQQRSNAGDASALKRKNRGSTVVAPPLQRKTNDLEPYSELDKKKDSVDPKEGSTGASAPDPRKLIYDLGKQLLGKSAGGQITRICKQEGGDMGRALSVLLKAQLAASPEEYIGAYLRNGKAGEDGLDRAFRKIRGEVRNGNSGGEREAAAEVLSAETIGGPRDIRPDDHLGVHALFRGDPHEGD